MSLFHLNALPVAQKQARYIRLVPPHIFGHLQSFAPERCSPSQQFRAIAERGQGQACIRVPAHRYGRDYCFSLDLEEAGGGQLELGFIIINDLAGPRFNIDVDDDGKLTLLGTASRNLREEQRAMEAGLGPCQVRRGLRVFVDLLPRLERFAAQWGYVAIKLSPLTYHTAIMYEHHGFSYLAGHRRMKQIDAAFAPGGPLAKALDGSTPFRQPHQAATPRGRSWAIHDGILQHLDGDPGFDLQMVKVIGKTAQQFTFTPPTTTTRPNNPARR